MLAALIFSDGPNPDWDLFFFHSNPGASLSVEKPVAH